MNNKFIKRVAAVVLGVAVMSTCAFASTVVDTTNYVDQTKTLTFAIDNASGADKISYIAYAGEDEETAETIVAVNQIDDAEVTETATVSISENLLGDAKVIVFMTGDSNGTAVDEKVLDVDDYIASAEIVNKDDGFKVDFEDGSDFYYTNVPKIDVNVNIKKGTYTFKGIKIKGNKITEEGTNEQVKTISIPDIAGTGPVYIYNLYVLGATADEAASMTAEAIIE